MPQYLSPGVYVEEVPPKARPIAGVGTSTAGFIGVVPENITLPPEPGKFETKDNKQVPVPYEIAQLNQPELITSWEQFKTKFGDFQPQKIATLPDPPQNPPQTPPPTTAKGWSNDDDQAYRQLQHAIYGFFNNGGTRCWVLRVATNTELNDLSKALQKFEAIDEIAIVAVPGVTKKAQQEAIIDHCEKMEDRVAVLDGTQTPGSVTKDAITNSTRNSNYAALYFPWIKVFDPVSQGNIAHPPSGHIAGVYARVDGERGVYKAPANEVIRGAVDLDDPEHKLGKNDQGVLNPKGVNIIRAFDGNIKIWGARTLGGDDNGEFKYISTRRYFNFLRESIDEGTQFVVFEPNSPALWERIKRSVGDFLLNQWRDGALFGETAKQAFFVKCDAQTNPPEVRELGQVVTLIGVAIVKPAEFVIFRIEQTTGS